MPAPQQRSAISGNGSDGVMVESWYSDVIAAGARTFSDDRENVVVTRGQQDRVTFVGNPHATRLEAHAEARRIESDGAQAAYVVSRQDGQLLLWGSAPDDLLHVFSGDPGR
jgi:hypothetical protein